MPCPAKPTVIPPPAIALPAGLEELVLVEYIGVYDEHLYLGGSKRKYKFGLLCQPKRYIDRRDLGGLLSLEEDGMKVFRWLK